MRLAAAAARFDKQVLTDAYGSATLLGQFDLFDDSKRDGAVTRRRMLSVAPGVSMPARGALASDGIVWLVGMQNPDYFNGAAIRRKYPLHQSDGLASVQSFGQYLSSTAGLSAYSAIEWTKAMKEIDESSDLVDVLTAVFTKGESLTLPAMMTLAGATYLLREAHVSSAGFQVVNADEIKAPASETGTFTGRTYDPVNDTWTGSNVSVKFLRLRWQSHFEYLSPRTLHYLPGDDTLVCLKSAATPKANDTVVLADGKWQVLNVQSEGDCWSIHARHIPG